jgi:ABC-type antimicrobial peptide transport system permease subunit
LGSDVPPTIFHPAGQAPMLQQSGRRTLDIAWSIRTVGPLPNLQSALRDAARAIDPRAVLVSFESMSDVIARDVELPRLIASLLTAFSAIGVLLAALGLYGLMAHAASQRTREVGIRIALGATATTILRRFLSEGLQTASVGAAVGIAGAALATRLLGSLLFGVTPLDAGTFVGVAAFLLLVATIARVLPASRAARTNPVTALRVE